MHLVASQSERHLKILELDIGMWVFFASSDTIFPPTDYEKCLSLVLDSFRVGNMAIPNNNQ